MNVFLDIETIPSLHPDAREQSRQSVKPPGNIKKPESIATWWETEGDLAIEEVYRKQALDAAHGELCAVGFATDDSDPVSLVRGLGEPESTFIYRALIAIKELIDGETRTAPDGNRRPEAPFFICHNALFDLGFLLRRCWVNNLRPPFAIPGPYARDGKDYGDTMTAWAGHRGTISLDRLCRALGVPSPKGNGMDGSQVLDRWQAGEHDVIANYNAADVKATSACWKRLNWLDADAIRLKREEDDKLKVAEQAEQIKAQFAAKTVIPEIEQIQQVYTGATMKLGEICARLGFNVTADFLAQLGFHPHAIDKNAKLYRQADFYRIGNALIDHIHAAMRSAQMAA